MRTPLRPIAFALAATFGMAAAAQNVVTLTGYVTPCGGAIYPVHIVVDFGNPAIDTTIYTSANCWYEFTFYPDSTLGAGYVETSCDGGLTWTSMNFTWSSFFPVITVDLSCNGSGNCNACFTTGSSQPWLIEYTNCTNGGTAPYAWNWLFSDGSTSSASNPVWTVNTPGLYTACLTITDADNCTSTTCDSVLVDANGNINGSFFPCVACIDVVAATDGPAGPPIPWTVLANNCSTGGSGTVTYVIEWGDGVTGGSNPHVYSQPGTYWVCITMADDSGCTSTSCDSVSIDIDGNVDGTSSAPCEAGFWVMQAYETDSLNPGTAVPIPNELWIWNLSTTGNATANLNLSTTLGTSVATVVGCNAALVGAQVTGPNFPGGTTVIAVDCPNVWLSQNAIATGTSVHTFTGTTGNVQFVWSWGDGTPNSTDPFPTHVYANGGPYVLCLTITDISGCTDTACDSVSVDGNGFYTGMIIDDEVSSNSSRNGFTVNVLNELPATGIDDRPAVENTLAWPNPVEDVLNLRFNTTVTGNLPVSIIDMNGRAVRTEQVMINAGGNNLQVPVSDLAPGLYMMRFGNDAKAVAFRFVKR